MVRREGEGSESSSFALLYPLGFYLLFWFVSCNFFFLTWLWGVAYISEQWQEKINDVLVFRKACVGSIYDCFLHAEGCKFIFSFGILC
jgi:hypothetical protein